MAHHTGTIRRRRQHAQACSLIRQYIHADSKQMQKYDNIAANEHHALAERKIFAYVNCQIKQDCGREELVVRGFMV